MATVRVLPSTERIRVKEGESILEALHAAGLAYRIGCRRGGCGVCKVDLSSGSVTYRKQIADTVMTPDEWADSTCLTCQAVPDGDVEIELRDEDLRVRCRPLLRLRLEPPEETTGTGTTGQEG